MNIIFESYLYPDACADDYKKNSKCILDYAAHNLCKAIYTGLKENGVSVRLVNAPNIGSFPAYYKQPFVKGANMSDGCSLPFCNVAYLKRFDIRRKLYNTIKTELSSVLPTEETSLLLYNYRCLPFIHKIKKKWPNLKIVMVVTDLPGFMIQAPSAFMKIGKNVLGDGNDISEERLAFVDGFVLLSPRMKDVLPINDKPWIQVEGIFSTDIIVQDIKKESHKVILYSGNLGLRYGIAKLLDAFSKIEDPDYRLWICGDGDGLETIKEYKLNDSRIEYKGIVSRQEVLALQKKATVLINPRNSQDEYTKYSFPSKTMEYLASGTPVVMSHLPSIPSEYDEHIMYVGDESVEGYQKKIIEVCSMEQDNLLRFGQKATSFIMTTKTPKPQTKRIIDFIKTIKV